MRNPFFLLVALTAASPAFGQRHCAFDEVFPAETKPEDEERFESWMKEKTKIRKTQRADDEIYTIPVVTHIIHDGSEIGKGSNISEERVFQQIQILNQDFGRTNADASETLPGFRAAAANTGIQFVLAKQDPEGMPTTGVERVRGSKPSFSVSELALIASHGNWPQDDYFNIYVTNLRAPYLGQAEFPFSNLEGIASGANNRALIDGVYIDYEFFGLNDDTGNFDSHGRTTTHETGHFLGLRHLWGNCEIDDYCDDTPRAESASPGCNLEKNSCGSLDMVQNYLDYTDDECMNLFTSCQAQRMRTVLEESPRRASLRYSHALAEPRMLSNDLGIRRVTSPDQSQCAATIKPGVQVRNYGLRQIDKFEIACFVNNSLLESKTVYQNLQSGEKNGGHIPTGHDRPRNDH